MGMRVDEHCYELEGVFAEYACREARPANVHCPCDFTTVGKGSVSREYSGFKITKHRARIQDEATSTR